MGGGKGGGSNKEARRARKAEEARQRRIREGTARINEIFDGGLMGTNPLAPDARYDPDATYYTESGDVWRPKQQSGWRANIPESAWQNANLNVQIQGGLPRGHPGLVGPSIFEPGLLQGNSAQQQFQDALSGGKLYAGRERSGGFDDQFFQDRRQAYLDYATPQLEQQYGDAQRDLTFALARGGLLDSSARASKAGDLQQLYDLNMQQVSDEALNYETEARNAVEDARASLIQQLNVTSDVQGAVNAARARSQALSQAPSFSPLANLFSSFTEGLGNRMAHERADMMARQYLGGNENPYTTSRGRVEVR